MSVLDIVVLVLLSFGVLFFAAGSIGVLRFPDVFTRLHAVTKSDNLGLGFTVVALALYSGSAIASLKLLLIWVLVLVSSATAGHLVAQAARTSGVVPWRKP